MSVDKFLSVVSAVVREKLTKSFAIQSRAEREARLQTIISLSVELDRIRRINVFRTGLAESIIADVIEGEWEAAQQIADTFTDDPVDDRCAEAWANFHTIVTTACAEAKRRGPCDKGRVRQH